MKSKPFKDLHILLNCVNCGAQPVDPELKLCRKCELKKLIYEQSKEK